MSTAPAADAASQPGHRMNAIYFASMEVMVGEIHERIPVVGGDVVLARPDVIADRALDELVGCRRRHRCRGQSVGAQKLVDRRRPRAARNSPLGSAQRSSAAEQIEHRPGCDQGDQLVLVDGKAIFVAVVLVKVGAEPVRESWC